MDEIAVKNFLNSPNFYLSSARQLLIEEAIWNWRDSNMFEKRRIGIAIDRRSGEDRRNLYDSSYFLNGGIENRNSKERRIRQERRSGWIKLNERFSVFVGDFKR
jgi:hypothetical protein